ncbi:TPA: DUF1317 family protein [Raoultella planticola]
MKHAQDDIRVGAVRLPFLKEVNGWLMPWGEVVSKLRGLQRSWTRKEVRNESIFSDLRRSAMVLRKHNQQRSRRRSLLHHATD